MSGSLTVWHKRLLAVFITAIAGSVVGSVGAVAGAESVSPLSVHGRITHDALAASLAEPNLKAIIDANDSQDAPNGDGAQEKRRHFAGGSMQASLGYINREKTKALNLAAESDTDSQSRADALRHFGLMLHCVQDFYLRSNYVELQLEEAQNRQAPYDIPLVDWNKLPDGYVGAVSHTKLAAVQSNQDSQALSKETADSVAGKKPVAGKVTQFSVANDLALRETQRQWNLFETLLRKRCGNRAPAVLAALRQASPEGYGTNSNRQTTETSDSQ